MKRHRTIGYWGMQFITSCISTTLVLLLLGLVVFFVLSAHNLSTYVRENINFSILLSEEARETDILHFQKELNERAYIKETVYISKEQALKEQSEAMGSDPTEFLGYNPFTPSLEVRLHSAYTHPDSIRWIEKEIKRNKQVTEIFYPQELVETVNANVRKAGILLTGLAILLTLVSFALINNTIRLAIYAKRFIIHTMKLIGADWSYIRKPFLRRNLLVGFLSGLAASGILTGSALLLMRREPELSTVTTPDVLIWTVASVMVSGLIITYLCAYFSVGKYLRMRADTLYYI